MQDEVVCRPIEFLIGEGGRLLGVDLVDGLLDGVPVLEGLLLRHDGVSYFVIAKLELALG